MDKMVAATRNKGKLRELFNLLKPLGFEVLSLDEKAPEVEETGSTFLENARLKAKSAVEFTKLPSIADDSGLCVEALDGEPGVFSARFGGYSDSGERNAYLLERMEQTENRRAVFVCVLVCIFPDGKEIVAEGRVFGEILRSPKGNGGFGYDPLFYIRSLGKTMAELSEGEKNGISHRGLAFKEFVKKLSG